MTAGGILIYGKNPVAIALHRRSRNDLKRLYLQTPVADQALKVRRLAEELGLPVSTTTKERMNVLVEDRPHQGFILETVSPVEPVRLLDDVDDSRLLSNRHSSGRTPRVLVALDEVSDPQNLGAILRSAYFFDAVGVVVSSKNCCPVTPAAIKASAGYSEHFYAEGRIFQVGNMRNFLIGRAARGWEVVGTSLKRTPNCDLGDMRKMDKIVVVLGNEGSGLRTVVEAACNKIFTMKSPAVLAGASKLTSPRPSLGEDANVSLNVSAFLAALLACLKL